MRLFAPLVPLASLVPLLLAAGLLLPALPAHARSLPAVELDAAASAANLVKTSQHTEALKGLRRVALTQFNVEFITEDSVSSQTSGFAAAGRASVTGYYRLAGVGEPDFQAVADALHAEVLAALAEQGLEVVTPAQIAAAPTWQRLVAAGDVLPRRQESALVVGPAGSALYGVSKLQAAGSGQKGLFAAVAMLGSAGDALASGGDNMALQKELGDAAVLELSLSVHFASLADESRGFLGRLGSSAKISAKARPIVRRAMLNVQRGPLGTQLMIEAPLLLDGAAFTEVREQASTKGEVAGAIALGLLKAAIGSKDSHSQSKYEVLADPALYRERVGAGLRQTIGLLLTRMASER